MSQVSVPATGESAPVKPAKKKYVKAVGPRLKILLGFIFGLVALLMANSLYLLGVRFIEWVRGFPQENYFYQYMFLLHLGLGLLLVLPVIIFGACHIYNASNRPNKRAVRVGYALFIVAIIVLITGVALMRLDFFVIKNPKFRSTAFWAHVLSPLAAVWLYVLHRLAGPRIKWRVGVRWGSVVVALIGVMLILNRADPRKWNAKAPKEGEKYFHPSLARTATGQFINGDVLMMNDYCKSCHQDVFTGWFHSAHRFSSFNNKPYLFSVKETRSVAFKRDGNVHASRWCAGCHDVVPFFSGAFDDPKFDDPNYDLEKDPMAQAGITCTVCHAITHVNSTKGNADFVIDEPMHYPFATSKNPFLLWVNKQLVKAKPEFHKKTFLKPLHKSAEFCSTCHKVSIPGELNHYKEFLRGQNHYDTFLLSGVSGHGARSFYYPEVSQPNCNGCHMPYKDAPSDFGAKFFDPKQPDKLVIHDHLFPAANTGIAAIRGEPEIVKAHQAFLKDVMRIDIFGVKEGGTVDGKLIAPLRPAVPTLKPGQTYLFEVVIRTVKMGHPFTQGTVDSNEIWVDAAATIGAPASAGSSAASPKVVGRSGAMGKANEVDPWSHFVNVYMLDREGNRIDRRNPQDIFTPLYNHQIPPGAGQVVHYSLTVPPNQKEPLAVEVKLQYRKFDTQYMQHVFGKDHVNDLPITTLAVDKVIFPIEGGAGEARNDKSPIVEWQRWNDYGIGLLNKGDKGSEKGELIQAAHAFSEVEKLKRADGPLNLARVYFKEGRLDDAVAALNRASKFDPPAPKWTVAWLTGLVNKQNGFLDEAIKNFRSVLEDRYPELDKRKFDFSKDYEVINELGLALFERAKMERRDDAGRQKFLKEAIDAFEKTLKLDTENMTAHYNLALIHGQLGDTAKAAEHRKLHERFRPDDNARDRAIAIARRNNPAADHAAQSIVIYNLQRPGAYGMPQSGGVATNNNTPAPKTPLP
jgi:tetratricopeptide (TPR) repeat protein